jgi:hypothetical protein
LGGEARSQRNDRYLAEGGPSLCNACKSALSPIAALHDSAELAEPFEPSRFSMNMIMSCEPAGPSGFPALQSPNWRRMSMSLLARRRLLSERAKQAFSFGARFRSYLRDPR